MTVWLAAWESSPTSSAASTQRFTLKAAPCGHTSLARENSTWLGARAIVFDSIWSE
jgi:hypothetical protein